MATPTKRHAGDKRGGSGAQVAYPTRQPSRWLRNGLLLAALVLLATLGWAWKSLRDDALIAAAHGAQAGCACRFISQRPLATCEADLDAAGLGRVAGLISLSEDAGKRAVRAGVPLLGSQSARFDPRAGCLLQPWSE